MGSLFSKKPSPAETLQERYPIQTQDVVWRFILSVPEGGKPKAGLAPRSSEAILFDLYADGEFGLVGSTKMPGCFSVRQLTDNLLLGHYHWMSKNLYKIPYSANQLEAPIDLKEPGFVISQFSLSPSRGVLHTASGLREYKVEGDSVELGTSVECPGRASVSYDSHTDRLWVAVGCVSSMDKVSEGLTRLSEELEDNSYDSVACTAGGSILYLKNRVRNKQFQMVVTVERHRVDESGGLELTHSHGQLPNPRVFCLDPKEKFLFTGGYGEDPTARSYRVQNGELELVSEVGTREGSAQGVCFEKMAYHRGLLVTVTEDRLITFRVAKDGKLTKAGVLAQDSLSFLNPIE